MSLNGRKAFHRARSGQPDANAAAIVKGLRALGHFVVTVRSAEKGTPDLCVYPRAKWRPAGLPGTETIDALPIPVWLEVKTAKGKPDAEQADWHRRALSAAVRVAVVRTLDEALVAVAS